MRLSFILLSKKNIFLISIFWLCSLAVSKGQGLQFVDSAQLEPIPSLEDVFWQTSDIAYAEGWLFVEDQKTNYRIQVYNPESGEKVYEFGRSGRGPGEYHNFTIQRGPGPGLIEISDVNNRKNDIYEVSCLQKKPPASQAHQCIIETESILGSRQALILDDNLILNQGSTAKGHLYLSRNEQKLRHLTETPEPIKEKYERSIHQSMSMAGRLAANPDRTAFAYFAQSFDWALFFGRQKNEIKPLEEYQFSFLPVFSVQEFDGESSMLTPAENYRAAFGHPVSGKRHYFVLYSGKSSEDAEKEGGIGRNFTNRLKIFDWKGNEIKEIQLSHNISILAVSHDENKLYGITFNEDFEATVLTGTLKK